MPKALIDKTSMLDKIADVFRQYGYEGASLSLLVEATGLQRATLYHHFPGGKEEMAQAVLDHGYGAFMDKVINPLKEDVPVKNRLQRMAKGLREVYCDGHRGCLLNTFSLEINSGGIKETMETRFKAWLDSYAAIAQEAGYTKKEAYERASKALIDIQGGLVFARITGDNKPFIRTIEGLPALLS